jgi:phosphatidylserine decarboxylase
VVDSRAAENSEFAKDFEGGIFFCHSFLNTFDYHRLHTPVAGKVLEAKFTADRYLDVEIASITRTLTETSHGP